MRTALNNGALRLVYVTFVALFVASFVLSHPIRALAGETAASAANADVRLPAEDLLSAADAVID